VAPDRVPPERNSSIDRVLVERRSRVWYTAWFVKPSLSCHFDIVEMCRVVVDLFQMLWTRVSDLNFLVGHCVCSICCAGVDSVNVVDAAADGILLNDSDAHVGVAVGNCDVMKGC
jgi:hypothetical protein